MEARKGDHSRWLAAPQAVAERLLPISSRLALAVVCFAASISAGLVGSASAAALNISGTWNANYHCEAGWCAGQDFPAPGIVYVQARGSNLVYGGEGTFVGTLKGNELTFHAVGPGTYEIDQTLIFSADGKTWTGPLSDSNGTHGTDTGVRVSGGFASISGHVHDSLDKPAPDVTLKLTGTSDTEGPVSESTTSSASGEYSFEVSPGTYAVAASGEMKEQNGGKLSVTTQVPTIGSAGSTPGGAECDGSANEATCSLKPVDQGETRSANFTYTYCAAADRSPNGKPPTGCPVIFIPGFLGSRLKCSTGEVWTNIPTPDFKDMALQPDGITDSGAPGSCASTVEPLTGQEGVVATAAGKDIYGQALAYLNRILPGRVYAYPYDWRKSPLRAVPGLNAEVKKVITESGASRVVLMAHSMGGLVTQAYISNPLYAEKVSRAITLGTPYWGAPKSHTALLSGKSGEPATEWFGLDLVIDSRQAYLAGAENYLQNAARNMQGLYWLYPSANFGAWLSVSGEAFSSAPKGGTGIDPWISLLGGAPSLVDSAMAGHGTLDGFKTNGVDYRVLVGVGTPTITSMQFEPIPFTAGEAARIEFGSGDGTVPARSATQGAFEGGAPLGNDVPISTACYVDHVALPGNAGVQGRIEGFLVKGEAVKKAANQAEEVCPYSGKQWEVLGVGVARPGATSSSAAPKITIMTAAGASLTLAQASEQKLVQTYQEAGKTIIVADNHNPVTLKLTGRGLRVKARSLSEHKGNFGGTARPEYYGPVNGTLTLSETGAVMRNGKPLKAARAARLPHTIARVTRHGRRFIVRLTAKRPAGVAATYVRIGKAAPRRYRRPLRLTAKQLKRLRFASVNRFGDWEPQRKVASPH
jgi:pimeloyl-ACP methyl ester carboxylesterase